MTHPHRTTRATYDAVAARFFENTRDRSKGRSDLDAFAAALPRGARVLDLGSGPGCDAAELAARGLAPICMDLSMGMLRLGASEFALPCVEGDLSRLPFGDGVAQGVWANACLLHLDPAALKRALGEINRVCATEGRVHVSVKLGDGAGFETERYDRPRFFQYWAPDDFDALLEAAGWTICTARIDERKSATWIVRQASPGPARARRAASREA